jgi:glycosyltransferase involved in cell wall biosynthesis
MRQYDPARSGQTLLCRAGARRLSGHVFDRMLDHRRRPSAPHIAFISTMDQAPWGGSEELWVQAAGYLARSGIRVSANVVGWPHARAPLTRLTQAGGTMFERPRLPGALQLAWRRYFGPPEHRWLNSLHADLVVISQGNNMEGLGWMRACARRGLRYASLVQNAGPSIWPNDEVAATAAVAYRGACQNFFVSNANLRLTETQIACSLPNARVVRNPFLVPYNVVVPWPADEPTAKLACVARLEPGSKGQDILFEVLRQSKWQHRPLEVTLFGGGDSAKSLRALMQLFEVQNVHFAGFTSDVPQIWASHHALVLPSRHEGLPISLVEAMLCGRPAIVTDVAGNAELVDDNVNGFVAAAPTPYLLDEALERAWSRRADWRALGAAAARRVRDAVPPDPAAAFAQELLRLLR